MTLANPRYHGRANWWYIKVNKIGGHIKCWLDDKLIFAYDDAEPINAGQMALWTFSNGIVLPRVQIFYENEIKRSYIKNSSVKNSPQGEPIVPAVMSETLPDGITAP